MARRSASDAAASAIPLSEKSPGEESPGAGASRSAAVGGESTGMTERCAGSMTSEARRMARRMTFRSSRTFPGQG